MKNVKEVESPNAEIDAAIKDLLARSKAEPVDVMVKVITAAVAWEKVKWNIRDQTEPFDVDSI